MMYQWQRDSADIPGETGTSLTLTNIQTAIAGAYRVKVTNAAGYVYSNEAVLTVKPVPVPTIDTHPQSIELYETEATTLTVVATGFEPFTYQWQKDGVDIEGETNASLVLTNLQTGASGEYRVKVTNVGGDVYSNVATLTVNVVPVPMITVQPQAVAVDVNGSTTFTVTATGALTLTYQWQKDSVDIEGATSSSLALSNIQTTAAGNYRVCVTNVGGSVYSDAVTLTVNTLPNFYELGWAGLSSYLSTNKSAQSETNNIVTFGSLSGSYKWFGGVVANDGNIYGAAYNDATVLKINTSTDAASRIGTISGGSGGYQYMGAVLGPDGCVYMIPWTAKTVVRFNPSNNAIHYIGTSNIGSSYGGGLGDLGGLWCGGVLAPNGCIYGIPRRTTGILKINPITERCSIIGNVTSSSYDRWMGGVLGPNGIIYGIPADAGSILRINPANDTFNETLNSPIGSSSKYNFGAMGFDGKIYGMPMNPSGGFSILRITPTSNNTDSAESLNWMANGTNFFGGSALSMNGCIYGTPGDSSNSLLKIDTVNMTATRIAGVSGSYQGSVMAANGKIYCIPSSATQVMCILPVLDTSIDTKVSRSLQLNKL